MNRWSIVVILFVIIVIGVLVLIFVPRPETANAPTTGTATTTPAGASLPDLITVSAPLSGATVSSPLALTGQARGNWYFEASAPYILRDSSGATIAQGHVDALGNWMTADFVPFSASIIFPAQPAGSSGTLVLMNDNPSGDPATQKELDIPVKF